MVAPLLATGHSLQSIANCTIPQLEGMVLCVLKYKNDEMVKVGGVQRLAYHASDKDYKSVLAELESEDE